MTSALHCETRGTTLIGSRDGRKRAERKGLRSLESEGGGLEREEKGEEGVKGRKSGGGWLGERRWKGRGKGK